MPLPVFYLDDWLSETKINLGPSESRWEVRELRV